MIKKLVKALKNDKELYYAWQANIAMSMYDELCRNKIYTSKKHKICNDAAKNFLDLLIK